MLRLRNPHIIRKINRYIINPVKLSARMNLQSVKQHWQRADRAVERAADRLKQTAKIEAEQQLRQTDTGQAVIAGTRFLARSAQNFSQYRLSAKRYYGSKKRPGIGKQFARAPAKRELKKVRKQRQKSLRNETKLHKAAKENVKLPKKNIRIQNKAFRKYKKALQAADQTERKLFQTRQRIRKLSKPKSESGKLIVQSIKQSARQNAAQNAGDDETAQAAMKLSEHAATAVQKGVRQRRLHRAEQREKKLKKRAGLQEQKLRRRQSLLHRTSQANKQGVTPPRAHRSAKEFAQDTAKAIGSSVKQL